MSDNTVRPLGEWLKQHRDELGISLEKAETETRIRAQYLQALEAEDLKALPNHVVARGFLRNYAVYLGLDAQEAAARYTALVGPTEPDPAPAAEAVPVAVDLFHPVPLYDGRDRGRRRILAIGLPIIAIAILAALAWWNYPWLSDTLKGILPAQPTATASSAPVVIPTLTPAQATATWTALPVTQTPGLQPTVALSITPSPTRTRRPTPTPSPPIYTGVFVELNFIEASWIQVTVDGVRQFQGEMEAGSRRAWYGDYRVELRIGNAGGVEVTVNGQKLGPLGAPGEVVDRVFETAEAALTTTPEITGTLSLSPTVTLEPPPPTATLTPPPAAVSPTPTASATLTTTASP